MTSFVGIDQGTSGTTVVVVDESATILSRSSVSLHSTHGENGAVEQDPWEVLATVVEATAKALSVLSEHPDHLVAGFAHQGETVLAWDPTNLEPLTPAIVWSDLRAQPIVEGLIGAGMNTQIEKLSGMRLDPYFCAAKYRWMLNHYPVLGQAAAMGQLQLGTLETWLLAQLGIEPTTDGGTASRTQLVELGSSTWHPELLKLFGIEAQWLVPIVPSLSYRGDLSHPSWPVQLPLHSVMVDQPSALIGTGGLARGSLKVTYGTGAFVVANSGEVRPTHQLDVIASVGWTDATGPHFTLDGGVFSAGSAVDWLSRMGADTSPAAHALLTGRRPSSVRVLPSLHGTGAPSWDRTASTAIHGIDSHTTAADLLQAFLDGLAFRVKEVINAMLATGIPAPSILRVDGGLSQSAYLMQVQADVLGMPIEVASTEEATALGAAVTAGASAGLLALDDVAEQLQTPKQTFLPKDHGVAAAAFAAWQRSFGR